MTVAQTTHLDIAYTVAGAPDAPVVPPLHGWPDDASTWAGVSARLGAVARA